MKIRNHLRLNGLVSILLPILVGLLLYGSFQHFQKEYDNRRSAQVIHHHINQLSMLLTDLALNPEKRLIEQWYATHHQLTVGLERIQFLHAEETLAQNQLKYLAQESILLFDSSATQAKGSSSPETKGFNLQLLQQLSGNLQRMQDEIHRLAEFTEYHSSQDLQKYLLLTVLAVLGMSGALIALLVITERKIVPTLEAMQQGLRKVRNGNPTFRFQSYSRDELGELAIAFDDMLEARQTSDLALHQLNLDLEGRIARRTEELRQSVATLEQEIAQRKNIELQLEATLDDLRRSNQELEQFAYVASHDLQEPLRMVSSYLQLIKRRYHGQLDTDADEFIDFAVSGAKRMQQMITDLLGFSRVGRNNEAFAEVDGEALLQSVLNTLQRSIEESTARVTHDPLPILHGNPGLLAQVLQNLISNAIKFHGDKPPCIHVAARDEGEQSLWSVRDNGIGIEPRFFEQLFQIFQRLPTQSPVPGTGIGLALVKKIVERQGGRIWVESTPDVGSTFFFTLKKWSGHE